MRFFLIVYDRPAGFTQDGFRNHLDANLAIVDWWHFLHSAYIVRTSLSPRELQEHIRKHLSKGSFLITPIQNKDLAGYLAKEGWEWITEKLPRG